LFRLSSSRLPTVIDKEDTDSLSAISIGGPFTPDAGESNASVERSTSDFIISDDLADTFNPAMAAAMDETEATYHLQIARASSSAVPSDVGSQYHSVISSNPSLFDLMPTPSAPRVVSEMCDFPEGYPFQPIKFHPDIVILVPIVVDRKGDHIHNHLKEISQSFITGQYDIPRDNQLPLVDTMLSRLKMSMPVVIRNPFKPLGVFGMEFLKLTYQMSPFLYVDIHGE